MELKKVTGKIKPDEVNKFNSVLKVLKYTQSNISIKDLSLVEKSDFVEVSFEVNIDGFNILIEKLALNKINLELKDELSSKIIEEANKQIERGKNKNAFLGWKGSTPEKRKLTIENIVNEGDYEELIKISRDVSANKEDVDKANLKIDTAINNAVNKAYNPAIQDHHYAESGLNRLLHIAGDNNLSLINKSDIKLKAGILSINLCMKHKEFNSSLVTICNNSKIDYLVCITAAVRLAGILNESSYNYPKVLEVVLKELNIKWLDSIFEGVKNKFVEKEVKDFNKLLKYVEENRG